MNESAYTIKSFAKNRGPRLSKSDKEIIQGSSNPFLLKAQNALDAINNKAKNFKNVSLEIGFGSGELISHRANLNDECLFIGSEVFEKGICKLIRSIVKNGVNNVLIFPDDGRILLEKLKDCFLDELLLMFPDPWPKKKHFKRRILQEEFLDVLFSKIKKGGKFYFASDIKSYQEHALELLLQRKGVVVKKNKPPFWVDTKYFLKSNKTEDVLFLECEKLN